MLRLSQTLLLSLIEGISAVLPLSDSGFAVLGRKLLGLPLNGSEDMLLTGLLQVTVAVVILLVFRRTWAGGFRVGTVREGRKATPGQTRAALARRMLVMMLAALPLGLPGILVSQLAAPVQDKLYLLSPILALCGILVFTCDRVGHGRRGMAEATLKDVALVCLFQCLGAVPGLSPVGLGIVMTIWLGIEPTLGIRFSCLLYAPCLLLSGVASIARGINTGFSFQYLLGCALCALVTYMALRLLAFVTRRGKLSEFAMPLWGAALLSIVLFLFS